MKRIMVVEDNADNRLLLEAMLGDRYELVFHESGPEALAAAREAMPDLILLDISLPGMDGVQVLEALRADESTCTVPVVALTAHAMVGDRERFLTAGFDAYVSKPVLDEAVLYRTIERLLTPVVNLGDV